jgi:hypothetical protein
MEFITTAINNLIKLFIYVGASTGTQMDQALAY